MEKHFHHNYTFKVWIWVIVALFILGLWLANGYNSLVAQEEQVKTAWSQVETSYQRRFDLIPNLVETVKGNMQQEQDVFNFIAESRANYTNASTPSEKALTAGIVEGGLSRLLAVIENYPELRSSEAVQNLMVQLEGTENRVSVERNRYNETVNLYNTNIRRVPRSLIATWFGFEPYQRFSAEEGADQAVKVKFVD